MDYLYDKYYRKGTRNNRPYNVIIIDEVDLMSIDKKSNQTILSTTYAGNSELITAMKIVWQQLLKNTILKEKDGIYLYINGQ